MAAICNTSIQRALSNNRTCDAISIWPSKMVLWLSIIWRMCFSDPLQYQTKLACFGFISCVSYKEIALEGMGWRINATIWVAT
jgi:pimeloyl-CoA synthetase